MLTDIIRKLITLIVANFAKKRDLETLALDVSNVSSLASKAYKMPDGGIPMSAFDQQTEDAVSECISRPSFGGLMISSGILKKSGATYVMTEDYVKDIRTLDYNCFHTFNPDGFNPEDIGGWRIPTDEEWSKIVTYDPAVRAGSTVNGEPNVHYALIEVAPNPTGVNVNTQRPFYHPRKGVLVFPDDLIITGTELANMDNPDATGETTTLRLGDLQDYLAQGCVFLPQLGILQSLQQNLQDTTGCGYWTSTPDDQDESKAWALQYIINEDVYTELLDKTAQAPIRLVKTYAPSMKDTLPKKADKVVGAVAGHVAVLDANGNLADGGTAPGDFAVINRAFPTSWRTNGTMAQLISDINADTTAVKGRSYLKTVGISDLPAGMIQAEMLVAIMDTLGNSKVILFTVTSSDTSPYHWEYTSAYGALGTWRSFQLPINDLNTIRSGAAAGATAYQKPNSGIPASDLAAGVIPDVSSFITKSVNDLTNYYLKSETYTKQEVVALIGAIQQFHYEIAASTAAVVSPATNVLYLIGPTGSGADKYEEYVYAEGAFVKIGDTSIDLSGYSTTQEMNAAISTALADYYQKTETYSKLEIDTLMSSKFVLISDIQYAELEQNDEVELDKVYFVYVDDSNNANL